MKKLSSISGGWILLTVLALLAPTFEAHAAPCVVPDNGSGTVTLPPAGCQYLSPADVHAITAGLPAGTTIQLTGIHRDFVCNRGTNGTPPGVCDFVPSPACDQPGGSLGGQEECSDSTLQMTLQGTGTLAGWNRTLSIPVSFETHVGPRTNGAPTQQFSTEMFRLRGQLPPGDPDFDLLKITAGNDFGMPSPGMTKLTQSGPNWVVASFFDITYRIDFIGHPGGHVGGMSGSTTATIRMATGGTDCAPANCDDGNACTVDACDNTTGMCTHTPVNCDDNQICTDDVCNPANGQCSHVPANCDDGNACTVDSCVQALLSPACTVPDNGGGTVTLPPAGCDYLSPSDVHQIVNGLPPGTTIQLGAIHKDFVCGGAVAQSVCSFTPPPGFCDQPGGTLSGQEECSNSNLQITLHGSGTLTGWNRTITVPVSFETHVGPRTPGNPVQAFNTKMFRLFGQTTGDPDFDLLRITAGDDFGLPSPGHTTLTQQGANWKVDSFFDITYRIDFVGAAGGHIGGMSGSTTATIRMQTGSGVGCVHTPVVCNDNNPCTDDACNPANGQCVYTNDNANTCSDGNACTSSDHCQNGSCVCDISGPCPGGTVSTLSNTTPVTIPTGPAVVTSTINVSGAGPFLNRLRLNTNISHTNNADLDITLTSPSGTIVTVTSDNGGTADDVFKGTLWDDKADPGNQIPFPGGAAFAASNLVDFTTYTNLVARTTLVAEEALAAFYGENPNGAWTIRVSDDTALNGGTLNSWGLEVTALPAAPATTITTLSNTTPVALADTPAIETSSIVAGGLGTQIGRVRVKTGITHTFPGDLEITVKSPAGTVVTLSARDGAGNDNVFNGTMWDDKADPGNQVPFSADTFAASNLVTDTVYTNNTPKPTLVPQEALGAFQGENPNGTWVLTIKDDASGDTGILSSWSIEFTTTSCSGICTATDCNDNNPCTDDSCDPTSGCIHTPNSIACNDGNACTTGDVCSGGACVGTPVDCNDHNVCTDDSCNTTTGQCVHANNTNACDDGNACTSGDHCVAPATSGASENFDGVTAPAFPAGWTTSATGSAIPWKTVNTSSDTAPNSAFGDDQNTGTGLTPGDEFLVSPSTHICSASATLTFRNRWAFESPTSCFDAGVLEISINGGAFTDIVTAGGSFTSGGYTGTVSSSFGSTLAGRNAWCSTSTGYPAYLTTAVSLPAAAAGQSIQLRWRVGIDTSAGATGQNIDTVVIADACPATCQPGAPTNCDDGNPCTDDSCAQGLLLLLPPACNVPDNGGGTVTLPPAGCDYLSPQDVHDIINGLPPGTTIQFAAIHRDFICHPQAGTPTNCSFSPPPGVCDQPGGTLGGNEECADSNLVLNLTGTGTLGGWSRTLSVPIQFETHVAPRTPGAPVQSFDTEMFRLQGQLPPGDPDFDLLRITAGNDYGLPSPGHTTLRTQGNGTWNVDSFFDITYRIDFVGHPGGHVGGMSGSTTATIRMQTGSGVGCVHTPHSCDDGNPCTVDSCDPASGCVHTPINCDDGQACTTDSCDPTTGQCVHTPTNCDDGNACTTDSCIQALLSPPCTVPDNGGGTVNLPPAGCDYLSPQDVHDIINGLPAGTQIQFGAIHRDFICKTPPGPASVCDFNPPPVTCEQPGGTLGGSEECSESSLTLNLVGTGTLAGWTRTLQIPVGFETHLGSRTPGAPTQSFPTDMYRLQGQLPPGDPDFDLLRITAGDGFGLPSPGHTTLTQQGTNWKVDSFFDITYRIDFVGHAGGHVGGMSGSTTGTIRMQTGSGVGCVHSQISCDDNNPCTVDTCDPVSGCVHTPVNCNDGNACTVDACNASGQCTHTPLDCDDGQICTVDSCNPASGCTHAALNCDDGNACTADSCVQALASPACTVADNGGGTVTLPPAGCDYLSPQDVHDIINGLPAGTTIQFGAIHKDFICHSQPGSVTNCSFTPPPGLCDQPGGTLGGREECNDSTLAMTLNGTGTLGGWTRTLQIPVSFETHVGPRTPGAPVQSFATDMFGLQGQLPPGDPDFDLLRITAGTSNGMPSPGHTTLTQLAGGMWKVDSFFDITYRIDFVGHPGGHIGGMSGSTTATIRMQTGTGVGCVHSPISCDDGIACTTDGCDPASGCFHTPGPPPAEVDNGLRVDKAGTFAQVSWNLAPGATKSDVLRGQVTGLPVGPGGGDEVCVLNDTAVTFFSDHTLPPSGTCLWYLIRGTSFCGNGTWGYQTNHGVNGAERVTTTCP